MVLQLSIKNLIVNAFAILMGIVLFPIIALAQLDTLFTSVSMSMSPQYPEPNQTVTASLKSTSFDLNTATITWFINGTAQASSVGSNSFVFQTKTVGDQQKITAVIDPPNTSPVQVTKTIVPTQVTLIWEAKSYTPPWYTGKPLYSIGSDIVVTAFPNIKSIDGVYRAPDDFVYTWRKNGRVLGSFSGLGKQTLTLEGSLSEQNGLSVSVEVAEPSGSLLGKGITYIATEQPYVYIYEDHPLKGILFEQILSKETPLNQQEVRLRAVPYFFGVQKPNNRSLAYSWMVGGKTISTNPNTPDIITIRRDENVTRVPISVSIQNTADILQQTKTETVFVTQKSNGNL